MSISVSAIKTAYDTYVTAKAATAAALATLQGLGARPTFPLQVITDSDYNNVVTAQATWDSSYATDYTAYQLALTTQRTAELAVITAIQNGAGATKGADEWFKLIGAGAGVLTYTNWVGYSSKDVAKDGLSFLVIETTQPPTSFINSIS